MKTIKVMIAGEGSYIGTSLKKWLMSYKEFRVSTIDLKKDNWKNSSFAEYDVIFLVAGIAHSDIGNASEETREYYYKINRDLAIETAKKAKKEGVLQFILMSSIIIYGESANIGEKKVIAEDTCPNPSNFYGDSKWQADKEIRKFQTEKFKVAVIRPPMIYGKGSKGNYPLLSKMAKKLLVFPDLKNERSMLHIDNLCEFLRLLILTGKGGIYFPQNREYVKTSEMVRIISEISSHKVYLIKILNPLIRVISKSQGKTAGMVNKAFGNVVYEKSISLHFEGKYQLWNLEESLCRTEGRQ